MKLTQVSSTAIVAGLAAIAFSNSATACGLTTTKDSNGNVITTGSVCPPPTSTPVPSPAPASVYNGGNGGAGGQGGQGGSAQSAAEANAAAQALAKNETRVDTNVAANGGSVSGVSTGNQNVAVDARQAKQATHIAAPGLVGGLSADGCVAQSSISLGASAVGVGGASVAFTTGADLVKGCPEAVRTTAVVVEGIRSDDPAKVVIGYRAAGRQDDLKYLGTEEGQADMALFAAPYRRQAAAPAPVTIVSPQFAAAAAQPSALPPCVIPGKKASYKVLANGTMVCSPDSN